MHYKNIHEARFLSRPNRFVALAEKEGEILRCHVKNTGRCRELLVPGARVLLEHCPAPQRRTEWDLVAVWKGARLINMDAQAPNAVAGDWLRAGGLGFAPEKLRQEHRHGDSRYDFYFENDGRPCLLEVKGVTLEEDGVVRFPDAPTLRGLKHLRGLIGARSEGFDCYVLFVVQMQGVLYFEPNRATQPAFAEALSAAKAAGVRLLALDCEVSETSLQLRAPVAVRL